MKLQIVLLACTFALIFAEPVKICNVACIKPPSPDECLAQNLAFVPKIGTENCCARCEKASVVTKPGCEPINCKVVRCAAQTIEDCGPEQVLVPADGRCHCCPSCVDFWVKPHCPH